MLEADFDFIMGFWHCPKPTIAAVHGQLHRRRVRALARLRRDRGRAIDEIRRAGSQFGSGAVALLLPWVAGPKAAKELLLTGDDQLSADRALALGIVNHVVPDGEETKRALDLAHAMARCAAPNAVRLTKLAINRSFDAMGTSRRARIRAGARTSSSRRPAAPNAPNSTACGASRASRPRWPGATKPFRQT